MKVYSSARNQRKSMAMNEVVRNNLDSLSQMLRNHTSQSLSLTSSLQSLDTEAEALSLAR
jgi:archaellum component FlaC